jgi:hypothetical protein
MNPLNLEVLRSVGLKLAGTGIVMSLGRGGGNLCGNAGRNGLGGQHRDWVQLASLNGSWSRQRRLISPSTVSFFDWKERVQQIDEP